MIPNPDPPILNPNLMEDLIRGGEGAHATFDCERMNKGKKIRCN
jgi:hypothetical protein